MSGWTLALLIFGITLPIDYLVLRTLVGGALEPMARRYPPQPPMHGAVRREFQSVSIGLTNLGGCVHMSVDERFWHVHPGGFLRVMGARHGASVPWEAIRVTTRRGRRISARVEGVGDVRGPAWALELAERGKGAATQGQAASCTAE